MGGGDSLDSQSTTDAQLDTLNGGDGDDDLSGGAGDDQLRAA